MNLRAIVQRRYAGSAVAFVAGMLLALSFAPFAWWPLAILAPALLMWLWDGASPRRAAVLGFWFNAGTFSVGTYWLYIAIKEIGHAPFALALLLMAGLVAIMGAYHALLGWAVAKYLPPRGAMRWLVGIPGAWLLIEWWRSWFITGFGWLALGYAHTDNWLGSLAPVVGQYGLGLLTLVLAGALVTLLLGDKRSRIVSGAVFVVIWGVAFALHGVEWTQPYSRPITVAVVQGAIPQDEKWLDENLEAIIDLYQKRTREAYGADLIVWPESAIPDLANYHVELLPRRLPAGECARLFAHGRNPSRRREPEDRRRGIFQLGAVDGQVHARGRLVRQAPPRAVLGIFSGAWIHPKLAQAHEPAVFGLQSWRGAAGAAGSGRTTDLRQHLLRGRLRVDATAGAAHRHVARERHQRRLVRTFDGALPASADFTHAGPRSGPADGPGRQ